MCRLSERIRHLQNFIRAVVMHFGQIAVGLKRDRPGKGEQDIRTGGLEPDLLLPGVGQVLLAEDGIEVFAAFLGRLFIDGAFPGPGSASPAAVAVGGAAVIDIERGAS
jgi:hypothetical protein